MSVRPVGGRGKQGIGASEHGRGPYLAAECECCLRHALLTLEVRVSRVLFVYVYCFAETVLCRSEADFGLPWNVVPLSTGTGPGGGHEAAQGSAGPNRATGVFLNILTSYREMGRDLWAIGGGDCRGSAPQGPQPNSVQQHSITCKLKAVSTAHERQHPKSAKSGAEVRVDT